MSRTRPSARVKRHQDERDALLFEIKADEECAGRLQAQAEDIAQQARTKRLRVAWLTGWLAKAGEAP
jgi:hypothetical protein